MKICDECNQQTFDTGGHIADCSKNPVRVGIGFGKDSDYFEFMNDVDWQDLCNPNEGSK